MNRVVLFVLFTFVLVPMAYSGKSQEGQATTLDEFLAKARAANPIVADSPSLFSATAPHLFLYRDVKARNLNDIVTIQIVENSTASNSANTSTEKSGDISIGAPALFGLESGGSSLNFANILQGSSALNFSGLGSTTRSGVLQAWLTAHVVEVLPNGDLVIEGTKDVTINREKQSLAVRGVIRTRDVSPNNVVLSTAVSHMEVKFDGKGIVSNANKPGFLYWLFSKVIPF